MRNYIRLIKTTHERFPVHPGIDRRSAGNKTGRSRIITDVPEI
ncbi:hypothetical protein [Flavilitoribacter nigricans]|nr:hypothetical protein [Flavilitoribacter nigricans]